MDSNKRLIIVLIISLLTVTISSVVYIHERDIGAILENRINIEKNEEELKVLNIYKAADEVAKINLTVSIQELTAAVENLNESVIRLEEQGKR